MAQPYVGEIRMFAGPFAPAGWMFCEGQLLPISENETLFNRIGTTYGGDGITTFALPDLRGRLPLHQGNGFALSETGGAEQVTLGTAEMPTHTHTLQASTDDATSATPVGNAWAKAKTSIYFAAGGPQVNLSSNVLSATGGNQPHTNMQPYLCINFIISLFGIFPTPS